MLIGAASHKDMEDTQDEVTILEDDSIVAVVAARFLLAVRVKTLVGTEGQISAEAIEATGRPWITGHASSPPPTKPTDMVIVLPN